MTGQAATKVQHAALQAPRVKAFLRAHPETVRDDPELLAGLGLRLDAANMVEFGPAALARVSDAHQRETQVRLRKYLSDLLGEPVEVVTLERMAGGWSRQTHRLLLRTATGSEPARWPAPGTGQGAQVGG